MFFSTVLLVSLATFVAAAPLQTRQAANPCFVTGPVSLTGEVLTGLSALTGVTCDAKVTVAAGVPDVISGGVKYSTIDFQKSTLSPLGFGLKTFATPVDPATADTALLQNQLNTYLAVEAGLRSQNGSAALLAQLKSTKFFIQFQMARVNAANGVKVDAAGTVAHQLEKVVKNSPTATAAEKSALNALAKVV